MPGIDFSLIRTTITMEEVLTELAFQPVCRLGDQLRGPCPVHGSSSLKSKTFSVNLRLGRYYCHKCLSRGNPLELWAAVHKLGIYDAARDLCRALGRDVPWIRAPDRTNREEAPVLGLKDRRVLRKAKHFECP